VLAGGLAGGLAGCSTAPPAAIVNGQAISVQQLNNQMQAWSSDKTYVAEFDYQMQQQAQQQASQSGSNTPPNSVEGNGTGSGVYGMYWASLQLSGMITATAVHQYLVRHGLSPSARQVAAAWASEYAANPSLWRQLPAWARTRAAAYDAEHALVDRSLTSAATDKSFYKAHKQYFWSQVCLLTSDVTVPGPGGTVDMRASRTQAEKLAGQMTAGAARAGGSRFCDSPEQFLERGKAYDDAVGTLPVGRAVAVRRSYGYQAVEVLSRQVIPYSAEVADDIEVVAVHGGAEAPPTGDNKVIAILKAAKISVNPTYGVWDTSVPSPYAPQVLSANQAIH
jgi:hypothetical protein